MKKTPAQHQPSTPIEASQAEASTSVTRGWREGLPVLSHAAVVLRELTVEDAPALLAHLGTPEASRFIAPLPTSVDGFREFIATAARERAQGQSATFGVLPAGSDHVVGFFQIRALEVDFTGAEWSFVLGSSYWGSGLFLDCARMVLDFSFEILGVIRLEARAVTLDGRGNGALRKIGAVQEGVLRRSFKRSGQRYDQLLWAVLAEDWRLHRQGRPRVVH